LALLALKTAAGASARIGLTMIRGEDPAPVRNQLLNMVNDERVAAGSFH
jgi:hypothetical protein